MKGVSNENEHDLLVVKFTNKKGKIRQCSGSGTELRRPVQAGHHRRRPVLRLQHHAGVHHVQVGGPPVIHENQ